MILQFRLKAVWKISKPYCMTLKQWLLIYVWKIIVCTTEARDETNDMKISSFSSPPPPPPPPPTKYGGAFFVKTLCMGEQTFWTNLWGDVSDGDEWSHHARGEVND